MTSRRIGAREGDVFGRGASRNSAPRAVSPWSAPDDSGAFRFADARQSHRTSAAPLSASGRPLAVQRLAAEAARPCFYCREGLERCDACKGRGRSEDRDTCDSCLGLGYRNCDFCGGSGRATHDAVAPDLRLRVAIERIREAAQHLDAVLNRPAPGPSRGEPRRSLEEGGRALLRVNRLAAMIEDALHALRAESGAIGDPGDRLRLIRFCLQRAEECGHRMREILKTMARSAQWLAEQSEPCTEAREVAARRAALYASLLRRPGLLAGTGFERPLLNPADDRPSPAPPAPTGEPALRKEEP